MNIKYDATQGVGYVLDGEGDFDESAHPRDEAGRFSASDIKTIQTSVSTHKAMYPGVPDSVLQQNRKTLVLSDLEQFAHAQEESLKHAPDRIQEAKATLIRAEARAPGSVLHQNAQDFLNRHVKYAEQSEKKARMYRKLIDKINTHGLPSRFL